MNYKKESQFTNNASKRVFEEVYTNEDMTEEKIYDKSYLLNVPQMFANNPSQEKAISVRRVICEPNNYHFNMRVCFIDSRGEPIYSTAERYTFTTHNDTDTILYSICQNMRSEKVVDIPYEDEEDGEIVTKTETVTEIYRLGYQYNKSTGELKFYAYEENGQIRPIPFKFEFDTYKDCLAFWSLLNQVGNPFNIDVKPEDFEADDMNYVYDVLTLNNVWSREPLYVHASFSNSTKHYLCRTGDFWFKPSKYYYDNINQNNFNVFFTTDGTHRIIPYSAVKIVELCFILRQFARL